MAVEQPRAGVAVPQAALSILYVTLQARRRGEAGHTHVTEIVRELRRRGHTVTLLEPTYPTDAPSMPKRMWTMLGVARRARREISRGRIDILYVRAHLVTYFVSARARRAGVPIAIERNAPLTELFLVRPWLRPAYALFRWLVRHEIRIATLVIGVTPEIVSESARLAAPHAIHGHVISNAANTEVMHPIENPALAKYGLEAGSYVVFVGAMARWQGIPHLLDAIRSPTWPEGVRLVFCGHGPLLPDVQQMATTGRVAYLGLVPYEEVAVVVNGAIAGVAPVDQPLERQSGSSALKVFEYLSCGRPAIVTDVSGLREVIREGDCGRVVPLRNPEAIAEAVRWLWEHPREAERMGQRGRALVVQRYSWARKAQELEQLLVSAAHRPEWKLALQGFPNHGA